MKCKFCKADSKRNSSWSLKDVPVLDGNTLIAQAVIVLRCWICRNPLKTPESITILLPKLPPHLHLGELPDEPIVDGMLHVEMVKEPRRSGGVTTLGMCTVHGEPIVQKDIDRGGCLLCRQEMGASLIAWNEKKRLVEEVNSRNVVVRELTLNEPQKSGHVTGTIRLGCAYCDVESPTDLFDAVPIEL